MKNYSETIWLIVGALMVLSALWFVGTEYAPAPQPHKCCPGPCGPHPPQPKKKCCPGPCSSLNWTPYKPIRLVYALSPIITDVESHLPAGHGYNDPDPITTVHECTHGINSQLRQKYGCPSFYALDNRAALLQEAHTTLASVAALVPASLRGDVYDLYLRQGQTWWQQQPTYVFDEWVAYTNGAEARKQLSITDRQETVRYAVEFIVYAACVPMSAKSDDPQMKAFYIWQVERVVELARALGPMDYLNRLRTNADAAQLRDFMHGYCGRQWTAQTLGF